MHPNAEEKFFFAKKELNAFSIFSDLFEAGPRKTTLNFRCTLSLKLGSVESYAYDATTLVFKQTASDKLPSFK